MALVGTARSSDLDEDARILKEAKAPLKGITPKSLALNALLADSKSVSAGETALLIDIGAESTEIILTQGSNMLLSRSANVGGKNFTEAIARQFSVIPEVAEEIKLAEGTIIVDGRRPSRMSEFREGFDELLAAEGIRFRSDPRYPQNLSRCLTSAADQIRMACDAALRFATVQTKIKGIRIDRVILSGGGAKLPGLLEYFTQAFRVPCSYWDAISIFDFSNVSPDKRDTPTEFANALALAYVASKEHPGIIDLVPNAIKEKLRFWTADLFAYLGVALVLTGLILWWIAASGMNSKVSSASEEISELVKDTKRNNNRLTDLVGQISLSRERIALLSKTTYFNPMVLKFLTELEKKVPETIKLTKISYEPYSPDDPEGKRRNTNPSEWRFLISGYVNKDVPAQQQPLLFNSLAQSISQLPFVLPEFDTLELTRIEKDSKSKKDKLGAEKGSYAFTVSFKVTENGELKYNEIR